MQRSALKMLTNAPLVAAVAITAASVAHAQTVVGAVQGTIKDDAGKPVAGAIVRLIPATGSPRLAKTNASGQYTFTGIDPGTYTVQAEVVTFETQKQTVTVTQDVTSTVDFSLTKTTVKSSSRVTVAPVRKGQVSQQSNVSARTEQLVKSQPNDLYQFPGLVFGQPGVTFDSGGYVHIRGGDYNSVGFAVDGVPITEPVYNGFATNIVSVGLKSASVIAGGADASFGGATGGFINEVTENGRDLKAAGDLGSLEYTSGPGNGWGYNGTQLRLGSASGKFDYYASTILFENKFPGNTQISKLNPSYDGLLKFNYYIDPNDTATLFLSQGHEQYYDYQLPQSTPYVHFDPKSGKLSSSDNFVNDTANQRYDMDYANYKHNFTPSSYANLRVFSLFSRSDDHEENTVPRYLYPGSQQTGTFLDYQNQFTQSYQLKAGIQYTAGKINWRQVTGIPTADAIDPETGLSTISARGLNDRSIKNKPDILTEYISNQFKFAEDKFTVEAGLRHSSETNNLAAPNWVAPDGTPLTIPTTNPDGFQYDQSAYHYGKHYTIDYTDPRVGVTYSPSRTSSWVFRTDYGVQSEFPSLRQLEVLPSAIVGYAPTASNVIAQENRFLRNYYPLNRLDAIHSYNFDIGAEKGFNLSGLVSGSYAFAVNGFRRIQTNLVQYELPDYAQLLGPVNYPLSYDNSGRGHASGADFTFSKRLVKKSDWNGFLTYTNLTSVATSEYFNGYIPYWVNNLAGFPGLTDADYRNLIKSHEVPTGWDQQHTVAFVANKRINKLLETTFYMDAGSGFPFAGGVGAGDAQHGLDNSGVFTYVPIVVNQGTNGLQPINAVAGKTGWHYKFTLNTNFHIDPKDRTYLFLNIDNLFDKKTSIVRATTTLSGEEFYDAPTPQNPQGSIYYGNNTPISPRFISFGVRTKF